MDRYYNISDNPITKKFSNNGLDKELGDKLQNLPLSKQLDICIYYLRRVYFFCYFCAEEFEDEYCLNEKCKKHLRGNDKIHLNVDSSKWFHNLEKKNSSVHRYNKK